MDASTIRRSWRTVFIPDLQLGAQGCQAELLLDFLSVVRFETFYLVGDVVDGWRLAEQWRWPAAHEAVLRHILVLAHRGVRVVYVPGNHDAFALGFCGLHLAGIVVTWEAVHEGADGRRWLVTHGDFYEGSVTRRLVSDDDRRQDLPRATGCQHNVKCRTQANGARLLEISLVG